MAVKNTGSMEPILVSKPKAIIAEVGENTFIFDHILKDSTKISQDDNTESTIDNELKDEAIRTNVTLGSYKFETTVEDIQGELLVNLCGFTKDSVSGKVYAPSGYIERYAKITVVLDNGVDVSNNQKYVAQVLPKVQLNSKLILESLSSSMAGFSLAGTAKSVKVTDGSNHYDTPMYVDYDFTMPSAG